MKNLYEYHLARLWGVSGKCDWYDRGAKVVVLVLLNIVLQLHHCQVKRLEKYRDIFPFLKISTRMSGDDGYAPMCVKLVKLKAAGKMIIKWNF